MKTEKNDENLMSFTNHRVDTKSDLNSASIELMKYKKGYSVLFDHSPFAISFCDINGIISDCNENMEKLLNVSREKLKGSNIHSFISPANLKTSLIFFEELQKSKIYEHELQILRNDGKLIEVRRKSFPLEDNDGNISGVLVFDLDITENKRAEELLRLRSSALEVAANSIAITNVRGDIVWVNPAFNKLTGYSEEEIIYKNMRILKSGKHDEPFYRDLWKTILNGEVWHGEIVNRRKNGTEWIEEQTITPVYDDQNRLSYFISIKQDITQRKEAEEQAKIHQEQLIQADKMVALGTLVSGVAHEINNPNNSIMLNVPILEKIWENTVPILDDYYNKYGDFLVGNHLKYSKARESLPSLMNGISDGANRIKKIIQELKDFARKEAPELDQKVNINGVVRAAINLMSNLIKKSTNKFSVNYSNNLPIIIGNFQRLEQVVINLIENSCQALTSKNDAVRISTNFDEKTNSVLIIVEDEGIGIETGIIKEITDPFFTTKREKGGTGLGLSVSSKIIISHKGTLDFQSVPGKGTKAVIKLPVITDNKKGLNNG